MDQRGGSGNLVGLKITNTFELMKRNHGKKLTFYNIKIDLIKNRKPNKVHRNMSMEWSDEK